MNKARCFRAVALPVLLLLGVDVAHTRDLTFDDRVKAQETIEQVYRIHRALPGEDGRSKPPTGAVEDERRVRAKVEDDLRKSDALDAYWHSPIRADQLEAEIGRMVRSTQQPAMLRELFRALHDDPLLVAECLARPILADRLVHEKYASDPRIHGELRRRAEAEAAKIITIDDMRQCGGAYTEMTWRPVSDAEEGSPRAPDEISVPDGEWESLKATLERSLSGGRSKLAGPARRERGEVGRLEEASESFYVVAKLRQDEHSIRTASVVWRKTPFDQWWRRKKSTFSARMAAPSNYYSLTFPSTSACTDDAWTPMGNVPEPRIGSRAVWTGTEMIVWGGVTAAGMANSGSKYSPATDTWTAMAVGSAVPEGRVDFTAVWTGSEMMVWGERGAGYLYLNTGGRYDPIRDVWAPTSTQGDAPAARWSHTTVWTGSEMIVWGGTEPGWDYPVSHPATGSRYDPSTDAWRATSMLGAPNTRIFHVSVWTGREMVVWGGSNLFGLLATGGR